ncbi:MAG: iron-sulfur cluster insertion protein ErpA [Anaerolineales bacterium]
MSQQTENALITVSSQAAKAVSDILAEKQLSGYALRIYASAGGCCGMKFGMALDNQIAEEDTTIAAEGISLVVDRVSLEYLRGATIDFIDDPQHGTGFTIDAPQAQASAQGDGCSCGSSCDCNN